MASANSGGEYQFRLLVDNAPVMIWRSDTTGTCDFFNKPWLDFTGRTIERELGNGWTEGVHPDDFQQCQAVYTAAFDARRDFTMTYRLRRHDDTYRWVLDNGTPYFRDDGSFAGYFGSCVDVTEMHETQEQLQRTMENQARMLADKEALLREVQHRVRNNLQLIGSLLTLQADGVDDRQARTELNEATTRVRAIALAQERLDDATRAAAIDLAVYFVSLAETVSSRMGRNGIVFDSSAMESTFLTLERAVPLGLIVNELLINAVRHAFPAGRGGTVSIGTHRSEDGTLSVTVADDGDGLPPDFDLERAKTLGLRLIRRLAAQLRARVTTEPGGGARFRIVLQAPET